MFETRRIVFGCEEVVIRVSVPRNTVPKPTNEKHTTDKSESTPFTL